MHKDVDHSTERDKNRECGGCLGASAERGVLRVGAEQRMVLRRDSGGSGSGSSGSEI